MNLAEKLAGKVRHSNRAILVLGDGMTDVYVRGSTNDCQEGCLKFVETSRYTTHGGAANAACSISAWNGCAVQYHGSLPGNITKTRFLSSGGSVCRFRHDVECANPTPDSAREIVLKKLSDHSQRVGAVLLSDYDKGALTECFIKEVVGLCQERNIPCVADCKRSPDTYAGCVLKCNTDYQRKYGVALGRHVFDCAGTSVSGWLLVVTAGAANPVVWSGDGPCGLGYDLPPVRCVNHVGAGDCFAAHLALALAHDFDLPDAARLAHSAGRVYVQHPHNRSPQPEEVAADLAQATTGS